MKKIIFKDLTNNEILKYFKDEILKIHKSESQLKKYNDYDFEFEFDRKTGRFKWLHIWKGKNYNYHEAFEVPCIYDLNLDMNYFSNELVDNL